MPDPKILIICGHYGCGKTNLAVNLALREAKNGPVSLVDLDIVNPYFRSSDSADVLSRGGVRLIASPFAGTNLDLPSISAAVLSVFETPGKVIFDVGGDDSGATALGRFSKKITETGYEMYYVVNRFRNLISDPADAAEMLGEIESACRLKATAIVNNSHLKQQTCEQTVRDGVSYAKQVSELTGLPVVFNTVPRPLADRLSDIGGLLPVDIYVRTPWE